MAVIETTDKSAVTPPTETVVTPVDVSGVQRHGYLFGKKIAKSYSPFLHGVIYGELGIDWAQYRLDSADIPAFMELIKDPRFYGASVTMPNKVAILPYLDRLTPECRDVGACNTLYLTQEDGKTLYCGANTDTIGIRESFLQNLTPEAIAAQITNRPALVIGGGGAARSAVYALRKWMSVSTIYLVNRERSEVEAVVAECIERGYGDSLEIIETVEEAQAAGQVGAIVSCIPDFPPVTPEEKQARQVIETFLAREHKGAILEMCYNPTPYTAIGKLAEELKWQVILGTEAVIYQGLEQDRYWTGKTLEELPVKAAKEAVMKKLAETGRD